MWIGDMGAMGWVLISAALVALWGLVIAGIVALFGTVALADRHSRRGGTDDVSARDIFDGEFGRATSVPANPTLAQTNYAAATDTRRQKGWLAGGRDGGEDV